MNQNKKLKLNVLSISSYGRDLPLNKDKELSGGNQRQADYASFLNKYVIIVPVSHKSKVIEKPFYLADNLKIYTFYAKSNFCFVFAAYRMAKKIIKQEKINCVSCDNPYFSAIVGTFLKIRFKIPLLVHSMAEMIDNKHYIKERKINYIKNIFSKINLKFVDVLRVSTKVEVEKMKKKNKKFKVMHAPFYVDFKLYEKADYDHEFREKLLEGKFDNIVLNLGRFAKQKDLATLVKSIPEVIIKYPRVLFVLAGGGPEHDNITNLAKKLGVESNIKFTGQVPYFDNLKYFKASDIFVVTSIYEGTCMTLHEAAICKLPIVSTNFAGARDLMRNGENGYLVNIGDVKAVSEKISLLLESKENRERMGERNYEIIKSEFSRELALEKYKQIFNELVK